MDATIPSAFRELLLQVAPLFTAPSFENFVTLVTGWIVCTGHPTIGRIPRRVLVDDTLSRKGDPYLWSAGMHHDPLTSGLIDDRGQVCTDGDITVEELAYGMSRRWAQEVFHHNIKEFLGAEDPQNG